MLFFEFSSLIEITSSLPFLLLSLSYHGDRLRIWKGIKLRKNIIDNFYVYECEVQLQGRKCINLIIWITFNENTMVQLLNKITNQNLEIDFQLNSMKLKSVIAKENIFTSSSSQ